MKLFFRKAGPVLRLLGNIIVLGGAFAYAKFQGGAVSWTIFYMVLPFSAYAIFLFFYPVKAISAERTVEHREIPYGSSLRASVRLSRKFPFPLLYVSAEEMVSQPVSRRSAFTAPSGLFLWGFRLKKDWSYESEPLRRGEHVLEGVDIEVSDFFGWMRKRRFIPERQSILVLPKLTEMREVPTAASEERGTASASITSVKDSTVATGIRDYQPGDRLSRIHWPAFARTGELHSKEFESRRAQDLLLVLDGSPSTSFEEQVGFAASILKRAVASKSVAGFLSLGNAGTFIPRVEGPDSLHASMLHLARFQPSPDGGHIPPSGAQALATSRTMTVITGRLTAGWVSAFMQEARRATGGILFSVLGKGERPDVEALEAAQIATVAGFDVRFITEQEFGNPEMGGGRR